VGSQFPLFTVVALGVAAALPPFAFWPTGATACEICLAAAGELVTMADHLAVAERVVLAAPVAEGGRFRTVVVIKGGDPVGALLAEPVAAAEVPPGEPLLLVGDGMRPGWTSLGPIASTNADWLRALAVSRADWRERVLQALPHLGTGHHTVAEEIAWGEVGEAPYASLAAVRGRLEPDLVAGWLDDPAFAPHLGGALHIYGYLGDSEGATRIRARVVAASEAHDATLLGPLLTAHLELEGPSRIDWIETTYFADRSRSMAEIEAALLALKLQGEANATVPRARVIAAFRRFIAERPPMAGSIAATLAEWGCWDAKADFEALLASGAIADPASEFAVSLYLQRAAAAAAAPPSGE
jgi:hypothetical protein